MRTARKPLSTRKRSRSAEKKRDLHTERPLLPWQKAVNAAAKLDADAELGRAQDGTRPMVEHYPKVERLKPEQLRHEFAPSSAAPGDPGGLDAAQAAANAAGGAERSSPPASADASAEIAEANPVEATVALARMFFTGGIVILAKLQRVEIPAGEFDRIATLDAAELAVLRELAPAAAPFVMRALDQAPALGALAFCGALVLPMAGRIGELRRMKREQAVEAALAARDAKTNAGAKGDVDVDG